MQIPRVLAQQWRREPEWLAALPGLLAEYAEVWSLDLEEPIDTAHSLVVPAGEVVLKIIAPSDFEAEHEPDALAQWEGGGAVRLLARDEGRRAFLMERCRPGTTLWSSGIDEIDVVTGALPRLWANPPHPHPFRLLVDEAKRWADEIPRRYNLAGKPFERSLLEHALDVFRSRGDGPEALANQDLHGLNILRAEREPWLVIDPKPIVGERELNGVALLRNAAFRGGRASVKLWLDALANLGLDRERLRGWGVGHALAWGWDEEEGWSMKMVGAARVILES